MMKKRLLLTVCMLCMFATLLFVPALAVKAAQADVMPLATVQNVIRKSDDGTVLPTTPTPTYSWQYGDDSTISYTFRPQHGDTVLYSVTKDSETVDQFAIVYIGDTAMLYAVNAGAADTETPFRVNSLNAYLKTLKPGSYSIVISVDGGTAPANHTHWYDPDSGEVACGDDYSAVSYNVNLSVSAYDITGNVGDSASTCPVKYTVLNPEMLYTGEPDNVPQIKLELDTGNGTLVLAEGEDYTLSSPSTEFGDADLVITGIGGFTGTVTIPAAYQIVAGDNTVSDVNVVRWKYGEYDKNVNLFSANAKWGAENMYFAIATDDSGADSSFISGLDEIRLTAGVVSDTVAELLNTLDAKTDYYLYAIVTGGNNYSDAEAHISFQVVDATNTWTTTPNIVSWEWHNFDPNVNVINAVPAFGSGVKFSVYSKNGNDYTAIKFDGKETFELEDDAIPTAVARVLSNLDAGTYYLFASLVSDSDNYTSINETFSANALVPFRVLQARNYWTQIPQISNWSYGGYNPEINVVSGAAAHGSNNIQYSIYKQSADGNFGVLSFSGTTSFAVNASGAIPAVVSDGLNALEVGKYYLRAKVVATNNYTGLLETVPDFTELPSFEVIKAENYWSTAPAIVAWAEGKFSNDENLPTAAAHFGTAKIVIVDVDDEENVIYDSENNINKLAEAKVGAYLLTATVAGTSNYSELTFDTIFHVFVPETATTGIAWWLVLIIVICSLGVLVFVFWLLHDKGILQMLTSKTIVAMRTKATMDATIAAVRANKIAEEAKESIRLAEAIEQLEAEQFENEEDDADEEVGPILIERDEESGFATFVRYQRPFSVRLIQVSDETKDWYSSLKNLLLSYKKVKSKVSNGYDAFNLGRNQLAKLVIRGKTLCLYLALDPDEYEDTKYRVERSQSKKFAETPCLFRIKSQRRQKYAEELIAQLSEKFAMVQGENQNIDYRPPYETTEELMEKGLIKKIVYKKKFASFVKDNAGTSIIVKTDDDAQLKIQEVGAVESDAPAESADNADAQAENPAPEAEAAASTETEEAPAVAEEAPTATEEAPTATEEAPTATEEAPAAEEGTTPTESTTDAGSDKKTNKKQKGAKNHVAKK